MRDVYKNATRVPIWLGDASALTDNTTRKPVSTIFLEYFLSMADEMRSYKKAGKDIATSPLYCKLRSEVSNAVMTDDKTPLAIGLSDIEQRRWWKRVWVVQEATLARTATLICGDGEALYHDLFLWFSVVFTDYHREAWNIFEHPGAIENHMIINFGVRQAEGEVEKSNKTTVSQTAVEKVLGRSRRL